MKKMKEKKEMSTYEKKKEILRDEIFETSKSFTVKELLIFNLFSKKDFDLNNSYDLKILLRKIKKFKDMIKNDKRI